MIYDYRVYIPRLQLIVSFGENVYTKFNLLTGDLAIRRGSVLHLCGKRALRRTVL